MTTGRLRARWAVAFAFAAAAGCASLQSATELRATRIEQAVVPMAQAALAAGQVETARRLYTRLLDVAPDAVDAHMGLGDAALAAGLPARAATWYLGAAGRAQTPADRHAAWLGHGRASVAAGDLDAARASFENIADVDGVQPEVAAWAHNGLAVVAILEGDPHGAVAAVARAVVLAPDERRLRDNLDRAVAVAAAYRPDTDASDRRGDVPMPLPSPLPGRDGESDLPADTPPRPTVAVTVNDAAGPPADAQFGAGAAANVPAEPASAAGATGDEPLLAIAEGSAPTATGPTDGDPASASGTMPGEPAPARTAADARPARAEGAPAEVAPESRDGPQERELPRPVGFVVRFGDVAYLQVGAFAVEANAQRLAERLPRFTDLPVGIVSSGDDGLYRVHIGPLASPDQLSALTHALGEAAA